MSNPRRTAQMLLQVPKKWTEEHLELANVRVTTNVLAEEIVDPSYIPEDGEGSGCLYIPSLEVY